VRERARIGTSLSSTLTTEPDVSPINSTAEPAPLPPTLTPTISEPAETKSADEEPARAKR
jgi:hypothetical protein